MKKFLLFVVVIVVCLAAVFAVWYFIPTTFLNGTSSSDIGSISVTDGNTGESFEITDAEEIEAIVTNIQSIKMKKSGVSLGYSGYSFRMTFYNTAGTEKESFIINSETSIRKDPFFYSCDGGLCYDYLEELEGKYTE